MSNQDTFIFTGPTLAVATALDALEATYLPPAKQGDIYRIVQLYAPRYIGVIDGYFNQVPAVWHKELLWALDQGVRVYGAASMGALRSAELEAFGMVGCGKIFQAYMDGVLPPFFDEDFEDDDEVAVVHGPAELGYPAMSEAMVNIRFTLIHAVDAGVLGQACALKLAGIAKSLFYPQRNHNDLIDRAQQQLDQHTELAAYRSWLVDNAVDQKQCDALSLLACISQDAKEQNIGEPEQDHKSVQTAQITPSRAATSFTFEHTSQWQAAVEQLQAHDFELSPVVNELRLLGVDYLEAVKAVMATAASDAPDPITAADQLTALHQSPELLAKQLSAQFIALDRRQLAGQWPQAFVEPQLDRLIEDSAQFSSLKNRAQNKHAVLASLSPKPSIYALSEIELLQLCDWYFSHCLDKELPDDLAAYAFSIGLDDIDRFYSIIFEEYIFKDATA